MKTKNVTITLSALTRVEYTEVIAVPAEMTDDELDDLVRQRWDDVDGGLFMDDPDYWEKGSCDFEVSAQDAVPTKIYSDHGVVDCELVNELCVDSAPDLSATELKQALKPAGQEEFSLVPVVAVKLEGGMVIGLQSSIPINVVVFDGDVEGACDSQVSNYQGERTFVSLTRLRSIVEGQGDGINRSACKEALDFAEALVRT